MTTQWSKFRDFVNSKEIGYIFTRQELGKVLAIKNERYSWGQGTADCYKSYLLKAKFLSKVGRGKYQLVDHLPKGLTMGSLFALLKGDNLTYVESIQKQKDFNVLKGQFLKERNEVLTHLINETSKLIPFAETIDSSALGLKKIVRDWTWELDKEPNPTKVWKKKLGNSNG